MGKVRLGVVLLPPPPVEREIHALRRAVGDGTLGRVPVHLTLVPPVNVRADRFDDALQLLREAAARTRPFGVALGPPTTFLPDNPVLYLPLTEGSDDVRRLRDLVFCNPLARPLTWPFLPHVTVADEVDASRIDAARVALADYRTEMTFDRVHMLQESPGRIWAPVADAAFKAPAVVGRGGLPVELSVTAALDPQARTFFDREWPMHVAAELGASRWGDRAPFGITARESGLVVGTAEGWTFGGIATLDRLVVAAAERGRGIGSHLLAAFESLAAEGDCRRLVALARAESPAEAFYGSRGWAKDTRLSPWVFDNDFVVMRRNL